MLLVADTQTVEALDDVMPERRRGLRIRQQRPVKLFEPSAARYYGGRTEDISAGGLRVELPASTPLMAGKLVNVHIGLRDEDVGFASRRAMLPARVIWIDRGSKAASGRLLAGVQLIARAAAAMDAA